MMRIAVLLVVLISGVFANSIRAASPTYVQRLFGYGPAGVRDYVVDPEGNTFIADGTNSVVKFDSTGLAVLFQVPITGLQQPNHVALDRNGNIYVQTTFEILKFDRNGSPIPFSSTIPSNNYAQMAIDSQGNIILADGTDVVRYAANGTLNPFGHSITGLSQNYSVALDAADNIYVTTAAAAGQPTVLKYDHEGTTLPLSHPIIDPVTQSVAVDEQGNIFTACLILMPDRVTYEVHKFDGSGLPSSFPTLAADQPQLIRTSPPGEVATSDYREIYRFSTNGDEVPFAHPIVSIYMPYGVALDHVGNIFVSDFGGRILKYDASGVSLPLAHRIRDLIQPEGMAFDSQGNLYVAQFGTEFNTGYSGPNAIYRFDPSGNPLPFSHPIDQLDAPTGVAVDSSGNILVSEFQGNEVLRFDAHGNPLPFAQRVLGTSGFWGITLDANDNFYVTEGGYENGPHRVRKFSKTGAEEFFSTAISGLYAPTGITLDVAKNLFVTSWGAADTPPQNVFLQKFAPTGGELPITIDNLRVGEWGSVAVSAAGSIYLPNLGGTLDVMLPDEVFQSSFQ